MPIHERRTASTGQLSSPDWVAAYIENDLETQAAEQAETLIGLRRKIHQNPELAFSEHRTTQAIVEHLEASGLQPRVLPIGTGVICDIPSDRIPKTRDEPQDNEDSLILLRADIDALPIHEDTSHEFRSQVEGVSHSCGHDVHTSIVLGAGLLLANLSRRFSLPSPVRLVFQPAEEIGAGGQEVIKAGALTGVRRAFALHCDPSLEVGQIGVKSGPVTGSCDFVDLEVFPKPGSPSPASGTAYNTNVIAAWGGIITALSSGIAQRRHNTSVPSVVWGQVTGDVPEAGKSGSSSVVSRGTVRCLDGGTWDRAPDLVKELVRSQARSFGVGANVTYHRGSPPTVNDEGAIREFRQAAVLAIGPSAVTGTEQSLGGEDFAWYLREVPGGLIRLGVRAVGDSTVHDLHQGNLVIDEHCIPLGVRLLVAAALCV